VRDALQAHLSDPDFTVQALAEAVAYSRPHMTEKVKETFGVSPSQLLRQKRLEHGAHLLTTTDATVTEIAYAVGFNSLSYFSRCFKEHYDRPPTAYRSAHT
jgi:AraC-like DNA-binding protein